jgi:lipooligosaccharide transport system ATP-binding protein
VSELVVEARALTKRYGGEAVVDGVDLRLAPGEFCGLLGPNGAGKTTLLRMLIGNTPPSSGTLRVLGLPIPARAKRMRCGVGVVPQEDNLDPDFTVVENLRVYASYFGLSRAEADQRTPELLDFAELSSKSQAAISTLSGGMRRRLSLVRALINEPRLLFLDEPTTGLDPQARHMIWQRLRALRHRGITLLLTTHYMEEAERLCDRVIVMDHGRILDSGHPAALIRKYIEPQVVEVYGPGIDAWHETVGAALARRSECVGETMFYYTDDEHPLIEALCTSPRLTFIHRPANLEDVFLKLTGRELREA